MVGSASAAPLLGVGSNANYQLNASIQSTQSCNATPVSYNQTACGPYQPRSLVSINDNGTCVSSSTCYYNPPYYPYYFPFTVQLGTTVMWFNYGSLTHTVTLCPTTICTTNKAGLQTFDSGPLAHFGSFSVTFNTAGNYTYYDTLHTLLRGNLIVSSSPSTPPSPPFNPTISLDGSIGWTVNGLDNSVAVLNVSHQVSIVASVGPASFTPVTETGSFSQSIDLSTRVESSGTATSVILGAIQRMLAYYPGYYGYYYGYGYPSVLGQLLSSHKAVHTFWWVNGPLANGQPIEILTGYASVTGSEMVNVGPGNNRNAWIVESELSQSLSTNSPPVITSGGSSDQSFKLDLRFDYDQSSDLLLRSSATISVASSQTQNYKPGDYLCGPSGCFPVSDPVTVNHHMSATIPITLKLKSTSLDLSKRDPPGAGNGQVSPASSLFATMSLWIYTGAGIVGAGAIVALALLFRRRSRMRTPAPAPEPLPSASPTLTGA
jgi:plastocyanin